MATAQWSSLKPVGIYPGSLAKRTRWESSGMFADSLIESGGRVQGRSAWTKVVAVALQSVIVGLICLFSVWHTDTLPQPQMTTLLYLAPPPAAAPASGVVLRHPIAPVKTPESTSQLRTPAEHPTQVSTPKTEDAPPAVVGGVVGGVPGGVVGGVIGGVLGVTSAVPVLAKTAVPPPAAPQKAHAAPVVAGGNLIHDVKPQYPPQARQARIEGTVVLLAVIGKDGSVRDVQVKSGSPLLAQAAIEAVKQWRYKPYLLNGQPVEVDTQITINFTLAEA